jgi:hypothetical protein
MRTCAVPGGSGGEPTGRWIVVAAEAFVNYAGHGLLFSANGRMQQGWEQR